MEETQEEAQDRRSMSWTFGTKSKSCKNCQWANYENGDTIITCGHHIQNFSTDSSCGAWTSPNDSYLLRIRKEVRAKFEKSK